MATKCPLCQKRSRPAWRLIKLRGKYNPTVKRKQKPNLQWVTLFNGKRIKACTRCKKNLTSKLKEFRI